MDNNGVMFGFERNAEVLSESVEDTKSWLKSNHSVEDEEDNDHDLKHLNAPTLGLHGSDTHKKQHTFWRKYTVHSSILNKNHAISPVVYGHKEIKPEGEMDIDNYDHSGGDGYMHTLAHMDNAFIPTHKDLTVYSGISTDHHIANVENALKHDKGVHSNRYTSTSLSPHVAYTFTHGRRDLDKDGVPQSANVDRHILKIHVPKGHPHVYTSGISAQGDKEKELVLPRNTLFKHTGKIETHVRPMVDREVKYIHGGRFKEGNWITHVHHVEAIHPDDHHKFNHTAFHHGDSK